MRVFFACPFTEHLDPTTGVVQRDYRSTIEAFRDELAAEASSVFLALEREAWGQSLMPAEVCTPLDYEEMVRADVVVAIPARSQGVAVELGWASHMQKPLLLVLSDGHKASPLVHGLSTLYGDRRSRVVTFQVEGVTHESLARISGDVRQALRRLRDELRAEDPPRARALAQAR